MRSNRYIDYFIVCISNENLTKFCFLAYRFDSNRIFFALHCILPVCSPAHVSYYCYIHFQTVYIFVYGQSWINLFALNLTVNELFIVWMNRLKYNNWNFSLHTHLLLLLLIYKLLKEINSITSFILTMPNIQKILLIWTVSSKLKIELNIMNNRNNCSEMQSWSC